MALGSAVAGGAKHAGGRIEKLQHRKSAHGDPPTGAIAEEITSYA
jgi:hypothetical protein